MIAYSTVGVNDMDRAIAFYDAVFAPLGAKRDTTSKTWTGYSRPGDRAKFFLTRPFDRGAASGGNGGMLRRWTRFTPRRLAPAGPTRVRRGFGRG